MDFTVKLFKTPLHGTLTGFALLFGIILFHRFFEAIRTPMVIDGIFVFLFVLTYIVLIVFFFIGIPTMLILALIFGARRLGDAIHQEAK